MPETKNILNQKLGSPLVFRSSSPEYDDESNQTSRLDKNNDSQSGENYKVIMIDLIQEGEGKDIEFGAMTR